MIFQCLMQQYANKTKDQHYNSNYLTVLQQSNPFFTITATAYTALNYKCLILASYSKYVILGCQTFSKFH